VLLYYLNAELYLIDPAVMPLPKGAAIGIGLGSLVAGLGRVRGAVPLAPGPERRGAGRGPVWCCSPWRPGADANVQRARRLIHYGAILGTIMVGNVVHVIIPGRGSWCAAKQQGRTPDPKYALAGRSVAVHNTYFTLPVLFVIISNTSHDFGSLWNWLVLVLLSSRGRWCGCGSSCGTRAARRRGR